MKRYCGQRTIDGIVVTVDDQPLDQRFDIHTYDDKGFEWSYIGSAPRQLALAILAEHTGDAATARQHVEAFTQTIVANLDNEWTLTSQDVEQSLSQQ